MEDDSDERNEALETTITVLSALPVIGGQLSAGARLGLQVWGKRKRRRFDADFELLMRELAQREGRQPDDEAWFKERLKDYRVEAATEKAFDQLLRTRDSSARLSIGRLYSAYVGGGSLTWYSFSRYGDFLSSADKSTIKGAIALILGLKQASSTAPLTFAEVTATHTGGDRILIIRGTVTIQGAVTHRVTLSTDMREIILAMSRLKRAHIGTEGSGGGLGNSGPGVIRLLKDELELLLGFPPYLLIDDNVEGAVLSNLKGSSGDPLLLEELCRRVDEAVAGGVGLGELEEALESLRAAQQIVIETKGSDVFVRLSSGSSG